MQNIKFTNLTIDFFNFLLLHHQWTSHLASLAFLLPSALYACHAISLLRTLGQLQTQFTNFTNFNLTVIDNLWPQGFRVGQKPKHLEKNQHRAEISKIYF